MKNWSNKKTLTFGLMVIGICLLISLGIMMTNRTVKREPTQQEITAYAPYAVDWQSLGQGSDLEIILSLCTGAGEKTIGENVYTVYTSETLGQYLYNFAEMTEIAQLNAALYIQYTTPEGGMVTLGYSDRGLVEKAVYDAATDTLFHELNGTVEVWEKFRSGIQFGA